MRKFTSEIKEKSLHRPNRPHEIAGVDKFGRMLYRAATSAFHAARRVLDAVPNTVFTNPTFLLPPASYPRFA